MSFFNKLFGGGKEEKAAPPPPPTKSETEKIQEKKIKIESALNDLDTKIKVFEDKEKKFDYKIELLKNKAKELIAADKKKEAKKYVEEATKVQKQAEVLNILSRAILSEKKCSSIRSSSLNKQSWTWKLSMHLIMLQSTSKSKKNILTKCRISFWTDNRQKCARRK